MNPVTVNTKAIVDSYHRLGWHLVPLTPNTKSPSSRAWTKRENCIGPGQAFPMEHSIGLALAYSGICSLDVDSVNQAATWLLDEHNLDLSAYFNAKDMVQIVSGVSNHGKLLFRMPPSNPVLPCYAYTVDRKHVLQFRNGTRSGTTVQDVIPFSIHPDTNKPYEWVGDYTQIPELPYELLQVWLGGLARGDVVGPKGDVNTSESEIASALAILDPDAQREDWLKYGMAVHAADPSLLHVWADWSSQGIKFVGYHDCETVWASFNSDLPGGITPLSLFQAARQAGWQGHQRPANEVFQPIVSGPGPLDLPPGIVPITSDPLASAVHDAVVAAPPPEWWEAMSIDDMMGTTPEPIETLVPGLIPMKGVTGLSGGGGQGKSNFMIQLAWAMTTNSLLLNDPDWTVRQGSVFVLEAEDDRTECHRRIGDLARLYPEQAARYGKNGFKFYFHNPAGADLRLTDRYGEPTKFVQELIDQIKSAPTKITCFMFGPLINLSGGSESNEDIQAVMRQLDRIGRECGCAVVAPHHVSKSSAQKTDRSEHSARGGSSFVGAARAVIHIQNMGADEAELNNVSEKERLDYVGITLPKCNGMAKIIEPIWFKRNPHSATMAYMPHQPRGTKKDMEREEYFEVLRQARSILTVSETEWTMNAFADEYCGVTGVFGLGKQALRGYLVRGCQEGLLVHTTEKANTGKTAIYLTNGEAQSHVETLAETYEKKQNIIEKRGGVPPLPDFLT